MELQFCSLYVDYCTVRLVVVSLLFALSFALCYVLINCFMFLIIRCILVFLFLCFAFYFVCSLILFCIVYCFPHAHSSLFSICVQVKTDHCHRVETQLQLINIISYPTHHLDTPGIMFPTISIPYRIAKIL
jgi:hypothetical protein